MPKLRLGFSLIELMIVVTIIGLLAAMAIPSMSRSRRTARRTLCWENQRVLFGMAALYELEQGRLLKPVAGNGVAIRDALMGAGYIAKKPIFDCPSSSTLDFDDYNLIYEGSILTGTTCTLQPANHRLE